MLRKTDRVQTVRPHEGEVKHGIVTSVKGGKVCVILDDGSTFTNVDARHFVPSDKPTPAREVFKKSDRVMWQSKNEVGILVTKFGVVEKSDMAFAKVVIDGGKYEYKVATRLLSHSQVPLPTDTIKTPMDAYEVRKYKAFPITHEPNHFQAEVWKDGVKILIASNSGEGGSNDYRTISGGRNGGDLDQFFDDAKAWAAAMDCPSLMEPEGSWVEWAAVGKKYGETAYDNLEDMRKFYKEHAAHKASAEPKSGVKV